MIFSAEMNKRKVCCFEVVENIDTIRCCGLRLKIKALKIKVILSTSDSVEGLNVFNY